MARHRFPAWLKPRWLPVIKPCFVHHVRPRSRPIECVLEYAEGRRPTPKHESFRAGRNKSVSADRVCATIAREARFGVRWHDTAFQPGSNRDCSQSSSLALSITSGRGAVRLSASWSTPRAAAKHESFRARRNKSVSADGVCATVAREARFGVRPAWRDFEPCPTLILYHPLSTQAEASSKHSP